MQHLIDISQKLGYHSDERGICVGIAHKGVDAILAKDLSTFDKRLAIMGRMKPEEFIWYSLTTVAKRPALSSHEKRMIYLYLENDTVQFSVRDDKGYIRTVKIPDDALNNSKQVKAVLADPSNKFLTDGDKTNIFEFTAKAGFPNFISTTKAKKIDPLALGIPNFLEGVELYQQVYLYKHLFEKKPKVQKDLDAAIPLISPSLLNTNTGESGIRKRIDQFTGAYTEEELIDYFTSFKKILDESQTPLTEPIAFTFDSINHTITIGYDPTLPNGPWSFINGGLPTKYTSDEESLAKELLSAFSKNKIAVFATGIHVADYNEKTIGKLIDAWKNTPEWQKIHTVTEEKAKELFVDSNGGAWLYVASRAGDIKKVNELLQTTSINPNQPTGHGFTPLYAAAKNDHVEVIKALLQHKNIDPNLKSNDMTALYIAAETDNVESTKTLLKDPRIKPDLASKGTTPLFVAKKNGNEEISTLIISALQLQANPSKNPAPNLSLLSKSIHNTRSYIIAFSTRMTGEGMGEEEVKSIIHKSLLSEVPYQLQNAKVFSSEAQAEKYVLDVIFESLEDFSRDGFKISTQYTNFLASKNKKDLGQNDFWIFEIDGDVASVKDALTIKENKLPMKPILSARNNGSTRIVKEDVLEETKKEGFKPFK